MNKPMSRFNFDYFLKLFILIILGFQVLFILFVVIGAFITGFMQMLVFGI